MQQEARLLVRCPFLDELEALIGVIRQPPEWCCSTFEAVTSLRSSLFPRKRWSAADTMLRGDINGQGRLDFGCG